MTAETPTEPHASQSASPASARREAESLDVRAQRVAEVAARNADDVDRLGRHPEEGIAAARAEGLLGVMTPRALGGEGAQLSDVAEVCFVLGQACASTAMIYAMHQVKIACIVRHAEGSVWHERFLRLLSERQLLVASSTTEGRGGGDIRTSEAPIEASGTRIGLVRDSSVISYGASADVIATTARRSPDAAASDQVLAVFMREDYTLEPTLKWDTLGMRGTCSAGFVLRASGEAGQVLPQPYEDIHAQTMVPASHLLWSSVWAGVAAAAVNRARLHMRRALRGSGGELPPSMLYFSRAHADLRALRALITTNLDRYAVLSGDVAALSTVEYQTAVNLLKVDASELAVSAAMNALRACGLSGYRNDNEVSVGRHLRDLLSAPMMINNDRILRNVASATLLNDSFASLRD